ncbi:TorF family putative porin [Psychrosphaera sp. B3R10]|uniref:TorF family putative porin n=1 Tax=Psychrosphaera algicola TaxID=3023714 RepID=A0ABT5FH87_9GAMM|nr:MULTISPECIES: TorF family putative porin [unclassified Psychrosphaera]MBU2882908.1 TorF family putative porin [Psychrosphaera sp. I2R16]MBU2991305.1 TorF family putative porin [Psychrosphaera sp. B3R10]MDC2890555.1 TorF family putative porin [Psychrosphaera sp. G1-22]MDO6720194.1 TorF family putative porin [Psychrosphaera sp. 1_MG-2023]
MKKTLLTALLSATILAPVAAQAEWSANAGYVSQYHFRGVQQTAFGSGSAGIDYEKGNLSAGVWAADVFDGLEIDLYGAYGLETESGFALSVGVTTYQYTGDFDTSYNELNLSAGKGALSVELTFGTHEDGADDGDASYTFLGATYSADNGVYGTVGVFGGDWEGSYVEAGYGTTVGEFDLGVSLIVSGSDLDDNESLVFSLGKSF